MQGLGERGSKDHQVNSVLCFLGKENYESFILHMSKIKLLALMVMVRGNSHRKLTIFEVLL